METWKHFSLQTQLDWMFGNLWVQLGMKPGHPATTITAENPTTKKPEEAEVAVAVEGAEEAEVAEEAEETAAEAAIKLKARTTVINLNETTFIHIFIFLK